MIFSCSDLSKNFIRSDPHESILFSVVVGGGPAQSCWNMAQVPHDFTLHSQGFLKKIHERPGIGGQSRRRKSFWNLFLKYQGPYCPVYSFISCDLYLYLKLKLFWRNQPYRVSPPHNKTRFLHLNDCYKPIAVTNAVSLSSGLCFKPVRKTQEERWKKTLKEIVVLFKVTFCIWNQSVLWLWHSSPKSIWFPQLQLVKIVLIIYSFNM